MTSSGQLGEGLPFEVRDRPKKSCSTDDKYVGCYMKRGFFEGTDVFFVPLTAGLNVSSYGDGTSCTVNHVICTNASPSPPSPPPQPPQPPWQPLSETFPDVGIATSGTCESHGGQSITSAQACELVATYGHPALPWEVPLQREFDEVSYEEEPKHCYYYYDRGRHWNDQGDQVRLNAVGGNCTTDNVCVCTGLMSPPPAPPSPPPPPSTPPPSPPSPPSPPLPPPPPSPPSMPPIAPIGAVRVVEDGASCEESGLTTVSSTRVCNLVYETANKEGFLTAGRRNPPTNIVGDTGRPFQGCNYYTKTRFFFGYPVGTDSYLIFRE
eukprot:scaffold11001_cov42-Phaeocystis_antarctica.AAC.1